jgi:primosomal protein N' (replication factor Y)
MASSSCVVRVAVPGPWRQCFDYLPPGDDHPNTLQPGVRVKVPFGRSARIGLVLELDPHRQVTDRALKQVLEVLDGHPVLPPDLLSLVRWASAYYHYFPGEVCFTALPGPLRKGLRSSPKVTRTWVLTEKGRQYEVDALRRAPRQAHILRILQQDPAGLPEQRLKEETNWRAALRALADKGLAEARSEPALILDKHRVREAPLPLSPAQAAAVENISAALDGYQAFLLDGITSSGKTEVYLQVIARVLAQERQALVLIPEINLTPQAVVRFQRRFAGPIVLLHSGLSEGERLTGWSMAKDGRAPIIIGTRSAIFTPLKRPGILIVDEEHDSSFKQHERFRYSARDLAVMRARQCGVPVVLGSATPSLESLHNAWIGRYAYLQLPERAGDAVEPELRIIDLRRQRLTEGLSSPLLRAMDEHLDRGEQVLLFLNRRGFAPVILCHACGWIADCQRCDAHMVMHQADHRLHCHHCGAQRSIDPRCSHCGSPDLVALGLGTERVEQALSQRFPATGVVRIDRDSTRRKGAIDVALQRIESGRNQILVGTQMLAKGHHFPNVTLVGILDIDGGLFSADFRATERMAQLIFQVAGRAGRAKKSGKVLLQTHHPDHPLLSHLLSEGYNAFARAALAERREANLPPFSRLALLRAEAATREAPFKFLDRVLKEARSLGIEEVQLVGPIPALMERRAGRYRAHLLFQSDRRNALHHLLGTLIERVEHLGATRHVRWSLDVDPLDL